MCVQERKRYGTDVWISQNERVERERLRVGLQEREKREWDRKREKERERERERESLDWVTTCSNPEKQSQERDDFCGETRKAKTKTFFFSLFLYHTHTLAHTLTHALAHTRTHTHSHAHNLSIADSLMLHCLEAFLYERRRGVGMIWWCSSLQQRQQLRRHLVMNLHWGKSNSVAERSRDWINFPRLEETGAGWVKQRRETIVISRSRVRILDGKRLAWSECKPFLIFHVRSLKS